MILTCPQCETQFELDSALLMPDGKRVRCTACTHDWFQLPELDEEALPEGAQGVEATDDVQSAETDIPDGVKPKAEETAPIADGNAEKGALAHIKNKNNLIGYGSAILVFVLVLIMLGVFSKGLTKAWPAMKGFYNVVGVHVPAAGEGLSFDRVSATYTPDGHIKIVGDVLNLTSHGLAVPQLKARMIVDGKALPVEWLVDAKSHTVDANGKIRFTSEHAYDGEHRPKSITISFDVMGHH